MVDELLQQHDGEAEERVREHDRARRQARELLLARKDQAPRDQHHDAVADRDPVGGLRADEADPSGEERERRDDGRLQQRPLLARDRPQPTAGEFLVRVERPGERVGVHVREPEDDDRHLDDPERLPDRVARVRRRDDRRDEDRPVDRAGKVVAPVEQPVAEPHRVRALPAGDLGHDLGGLGRRRADADPLLLERRLLGLGRARRARDDRARVAHRLAGRSREARDVGDDRLRQLGLDEGGRLLLLVTADLADHDDVLGLGVGLELREDVDERRADDGVAADPDDRRVAEPHPGQLVTDLVGQRAGARDEADVPRGEDLGRDDPDVRLAGRERSRAVRADQRHARL